MGILSAGALKRTLAVDLARPVSLDAIFNSMSTMREEIRQQPESIERTLKAEWRSLERLRNHLGANRPRLIILAARGTSDNAAQFGRYLLEVTTGIPVSLAAPSVYTLYDANIDLRDALVVRFRNRASLLTRIWFSSAQKTAGAMTIGITNEAESTLARVAGQTFLVERARSAASLQQRRIRVNYLSFTCWHRAWRALKPRRFEGLPGFANSALKLEKEIQARAERYRFMQHAVVIGRGLNYSNSFEFALKLMETCYIVAERFSSADLHKDDRHDGRVFPGICLRPRRRHVEINCENCSSG